MKRAVHIALATVAVLGAACIGFANDTYYPYQTYDEYHRTITSPEPPPSQPPAPQPVPEKPKPVRPDEPIKLSQPPEFLFPRELGYGVAVGVPYDLFYVGKEYYLLKSGNWYRAHSYRGPWMLQGRSKVPPELRKHDLKTIRDARNREFEIYWKDKAGYKGRYLRPDETLTPAPSTAPRKKEQIK